MAPSEVLRHFRGQPGRRHAGRTAGFHLGRQRRAGGFPPRMPPLWKALGGSVPPAGVELPAESVAPVPSRTWPCDSRTFKQLQAAGRSKLVISPVGLLASITCGPQPAAAAAACCRLPPAAAIAAALLSSLAPCSHAATQRPM